MDKELVKYQDTMVEALIASPMDTDGIIEEIDGTYYFVL